MRASGHPCAHLADWPSEPLRSRPASTKRRRCMPVEAPTWLNPGDTSWQMTAATLVGLMSVPGLVVLYGGVMQKRWSVNSMMLAFVAFSARAGRLGAVRIQDGLRHAVPRGVASRVLRELHRASRDRCSSHKELQGQGNDPVDREGPQFALPEIDARLLPVRVRRDHADPDARARCSGGSTSRPGSRSCCCGSRSSTASTRS